MQKRLSAFIETLQRAKTLDDLQAVILGLRAHFDVEHLVYHSVNSTGQQYAVLTYETDWVDRYLEQDYARIDPVVQGCFRRFHPVDWKNLDWSGRQSRAFLSEALDAGVGNQGYSVPIRGPNGQFAMFTVSHRASDTDWQKFTAENVAELLLVAHFVNHKALEIERGTDFHAMQSLSPREIDVLTMLAMGLNRAQAADNLAISEHTVRTYVESARFKLGANNTTHAVARAVAEGFVMI
ncbi:HTH-type quorum sensing-dependent transcriptional regulator VjbR [Defluviimonas aquaemixtae]|uniref:HTH-type quorum sensing-dependent transcriptional regulator VjbR n=1 Tax=Albidovulum aquaemixtae TaxID=1542388 RepID=A0A2R8BMC8_9RHOB|nr:LuxR family transcriptional regulator [Defluviimonas aquaemixtae]SPH24573.1 HTH-type quorum sensing-dependent transcriptional regulator VjbR [Defluviimonas aquaemixtae]